MPDEPKATASSVAQVFRKKNGCTGSYQDAYCSFRETEFKLHIHIAKYPGSQGFRIEWISITDATGSERAGSMDGVHHVMHNFAIDYTSDEWRAASQGITGRDTKEAEEAMIRLSHHVAKLDE